MSGRVVVGLLLVLVATAPAAARVSVDQVSINQVSISVGIGVPSLDIGIHLPALPTLTLVPGSPVYYAPSVDANYFFYDGLYWAYQNDNWYSSSWYNGPWALVEPNIVPDFVLRVPVRYYRRPPAYFHGWAANAPPRWDEHWGPSWAQKHSGWNHVDRAHIPAPAPIPTYQRRYTGNRYPTPQQQPVLHSRNYKYQPREEVVRQHYAQHAAPHEDTHHAAHEGEAHKR
ncbi:MAG TPA: hypothetical protein VJX92_17800 [Methylomirabilota bacterium]|nr:hypothetical protein [Methylomirabilota bacterium]